MSQQNITDTSIKLNISAEPDPQLESQVGKAVEVVTKAQVRANRKASSEMIAEMSRIGKEAQANMRANELFTAPKPDKERLRDWLGTWATGRSGAEEAAELANRRANADIIAAQRAAEADERDRQSREREGDEKRRRIMAYAGIDDLRDRQITADREAARIREEAAEEHARSQQRMNDAIHDARRRVMSTEERINDEHEQRVKLIRQELSLSQQERQVLEAQSDEIRQQAMTRNARTIDYERTNAALHAAGKNARMGPMMQEAGRGLEDFIIGFSMAKTNAEGLALGLRGAANNMGQLASYAGPMLGAYVAVGAALATIIVPKAIEWLWNTKELTKEIEEYENHLKRIEGMKGDESRAKIDAKNIENIEDLRKTENKILEDRNVLEEELSALLKEQVIQHKLLKIAQADEEKFMREQQNWYQAKLFRSGLRLLSGESGKVSRQTEFTDKINKAVRDKQSEFRKSAEQFRQLEDVRDPLIQKDIAEREMKASELAEKLKNEMLLDEARELKDKRFVIEKEYYDKESEIRKLALKDKAKEDELYELNRHVLTTKMDKLLAAENDKAAEAFIKKQETKEKLKNAILEEEARALKDKEFLIAQEYRENNRNINKQFADDEEGRREAHQLNERAHIAKMTRYQEELVERDDKKRSATEEMARKLEADIMEDEARAAATKRLRIEQEYYENQRQIRKLAKEDQERLQGLNTRSYTAQLDRLMGDENRDAAVSAINAKIESQQAKIEGLRGGSRSNGPSAHAFAGSQAAAAIINRAITGSATMEDILRKQLKVEENQLKELQRQKKAITVRI